MRRTVAAALVTAAVLVAPAPAGAAVGNDDRRLSNERSLSRWAYVLGSTWARHAPSRSGRRVKRLGRHVPGTGSRELVLALRQHTAPDGTVWVKARLPMRPNNRTGWLPRSRLGGYRSVRKLLVIDRRRLRAVLLDYRSGHARRAWSSRIGVGKQRWPTPRGRFYVRERLPVPRTPRLRAWYGPFAFGTSAHSPTLTGGNWGEGVIGIHGTGWPWLIPGRVSHGCVRVTNSRIQHLRRLAPLGTPIRIR
jgi:L,D-transpeptidase catalytic domain